ncbi:hypothetical protein WAI453_011786 [Rhynchosporium graminicola]
MRRLKACRGPMTRSQFSSNPICDIGARHHLSQDDNQSGPSNEVLEPSLFGLDAFSIDQDDDFRKLLHENDSDWALDFGGVLGIKDISELHYRASPNADS